MLLALNAAVEQSCLHLSLYQPGPLTLPRFAWICDHLFCPEACGTGSEASNFVGEMLAA